MTIQNLPVAIIGGGPVGLAALAHLLERGETPILFEAGATIGANVRDWQHVRMFSPWEFNVDAAVVRLLEANGWTMPPKDELPTGKDLADNYMLPFAAMPDIAQYINLNARVVAVSRRDVDKMKDKSREDAPFILHIQYADGNETLVEARAVIDASGTWHNPNPLGSGGLPAIGEKQHRDVIAYGIPDVLGADAMTYANQRVMVVGGGHSAINALLELVELQKQHEDTRISWVLRTNNMQRVYGGGDDDQLPARGALGNRIRAAVEAGIVTIIAPFRIRQISSDLDGVMVTGDCNGQSDYVVVDKIITVTGARPDLEMLREVRLDLDAATESTRQLAPLIDPNIHSCGTVRPHGEAELRQPENNFYIVGMKSYGRAPTFLLATGYEQVRSVVAALVGDWEAARDVQLNLPETGVCSTDFDDDVSCCGTPATTEAATISLGNIPVSNVNLVSSTRAKDKPSSCC